MTLFHDPATRKQLGELWEDVHTFARCVHGLGAGRGPKVKGGQGPMKSRVIKNTMSRYLRVPLKSTC